MLQLIVYTWIQLARHRVTPIQLSCSKEEKQSARAAHSTDKYTWSGWILAVRSNQLRYETVGEKERSLHYCYKAPNACILDCAHTNRATWQTQSQRDNSA